MRLWYSKGIDDPILFHQALLTGGQYDGINGLVNPYVEPPAVTVPDYIQHNDYPLLYDDDPRWAAEIVEILWAHIPDWRNTYAKQVAADEERYGIKFEQLRCNIPRSWEKDLWEGTSLLRQGAFRTPGPYVEAEWPAQCGNVLLLWALQAKNPDIWREPPPKGTVRFVDGIMETQARLTAVVHAACRATWGLKWGLMAARPEEAILAPAVQEQVKSSAVWPLWIRTRPFERQEWTSYRGGCPKHPSWPSGHAAHGGAMATVLRHMLNTDAVVHGVRVGDEIDLMEKAIGAGRLHGGIHYPCDLRAGTAVGRHVATLMLND